MSTSHELVCVPVLCPDAVMFAWRLHDWPVDELGAVQRSVWRRRATGDPDRQQRQLWARAEDAAVQHRSLRVVLLRVVLLRDLCVLVLRSSF